MSIRMVMVAACALAVGFSAGCQDKASVSLNEAKPAEKKSEAAADNADKADKAASTDKAKANAAPKKADAVKPATADKAAAKADKDAEKADPNEVVFDPRKPPAGYTTCHRNHCHKVGGGVASYKQVMEEIGATKIVGVPKQAPMPKAPADVAAAPADAQATASGLKSKVLTAGDGKAKPTATSVVTVHYTGWTTDGKAFDSSIARGKPATFPLNRVMPGWSEGLQLMSVGEERRMWIPEELAYKGRPGRPAGTLVFDVELIGIK